MSRKRITTEKAGDVKFHNPERQEEAHRLLEQAKRQEEQYTIKPVRVDSKTVVLKKVKKKRQ